jgi:3-deoxy-7-phosphoheptulonate synthase
VHRISSPYKLAGRAFRPEGTVVEFPNGAKIGGEQVAVIAGPCAIENPRTDFQTAARVKAAGASFCAEAPSSRAVRRTPFRAGNSGAATDARGRAGNGLLTVSEVMEISQIEPMLPYTIVSRWARATCRTSTCCASWARCASRCC